MNAPETPRLMMRVWEWPSRDQTAWRRACEPCDPFDASRGRASIWRASTRGVYEDGYGRWLAWLEESGRLERNATPDERATEDNVRAFCRRLQEDGLAPYTVAGYLMGLSRVLAAMMPDLDFSWISIASRRLHLQARPIKDVTGCFRPVEELLALANELMWEAEHGRFRSPFSRATLFRDGLIIALLTHRPMRIANLAAINIGRQLERDVEGWRLAFTAEEMKAGRPFGFPWPDALEGSLQRYLDIHRCVLMEGAAPEADGPLWVTRGMRPLASTDIRVRVKKWTGEEFGTPITPHAFRHLAATTIAKEDPDGVTNIPAILAHAGLEASDAYYNKAKQIDAARGYQVVLAEMRRGGARRRRRPAQ